MDGLLKILIFLILLMLGAWGINTYKHIRAGGWKGFAAAVDVVGALLLAGVLVMLILPLLR